MGIASRRSERKHSKKSIQATIHLTISGENSTLLRIEPLWLATPLNANGDRTLSDVSSNNSKAFLRSNKTIAHHRKED